MKYLISIDLDGTLKNQSGKISKRAKQVIKKLEERGHYIVLNSGRPRTYTEEIANKLNNKNYLISSNGSVIYDLVNKKLLNIDYIDLLALTDIFNLANQKKIRVVLVNDNEEYVTQYKVNNLQTLITEIPSNKNFNQMFIMSKDIENIKKLKEEIELKKYDTISIMYALFNDSGWLSISKKNTNKGSSVKYLKNFIKEDITTISIGNDYNDIPMFKESDISVVVSNATDEIKKHADITVLSNTEDGVAKYLETLL